MSSLIGAARWASAATLMRAGLQFMQLIVLARCLENRDMGVAVLTFSLIAMMQVFSDIGLNNIILHRRDLSPLELASLYGIGLGFGFFLFAASFPLSILASGFYDEERLIPIVTGIGSVFFLNSFWSQPKAIAERDFLFSKVAVCEIAAGVASFCSLLLVAVLYKTPFSVVISAIVYSIGMCAGFYAFADLRPRHGLSFSFKTVRPFIAYSSFNFGFSVVNSITSQADVLIGARVLGASQMGGYGMSKDLGLKVALVINNTATRVSSPLLSKFQSDSAGLRRVYAQVLGVVTFLNFPIYVSMLFYATEWLTFLFGSKWSSSSIIFLAFAVWGLVRSVGHPSGVLLFVTGQSKRAFIFSVFTALFFVPVFYFSSRYGVEALVFGMLGILVLQQIFPVWYFLVRPSTGIGYFEYWTPPMRALFCALIAFGPYSVLSFSRDGGSLGFFFSQLVGALLYICASLFFNRECCESLLRAVGLGAFSKPRN